MDIKQNNETKFHLFVCTRDKPNNKPCCSQKGSNEIYNELRSWIKENDLKPKIKVTSSGCLGHCSDGTAACLQPSNKYLLKVTKEDLPEIKKLLLK